MNKLTILVIFLVTFARYLNGQQCNQKGLLDFDANIARLLSFANAGRQYPTSKGEPLKKWCDESNTLINGVEVYKNQCLKDLPKQVSSLLVYGIKNLLRQLCRKFNQKMAEFLEATPCINKNDPIVTKCYTHLIDNILGTQNAVDNKKIPHLCCEIENLLECINKKLTKAPGCTEKNVEVIIDVLKSIIGNALDLICGDYVEGSDKCQSLGPAPKKKKSQKRSRSLALPIINLLSSFPAV